MSHTHSIRVRVPGPQPGSFRYGKRREMKKKIKKMSKKARKDIFECVVDDDMPDGAYFALAEEFGLEPEDLVEEDD